MKFAVIQNEFGEVGVDDKILSEEVAEEVIEVMNGCICCTVRGDLVTTLKKLYKRVEKFDGILIETTGLADPAPVVQTFFVDDDVKSKYRIDCVITVVDAKYILERLAEKKPEGVENEAVEQVCFADKVLLNKTDLSTPEGLVKIKEEIKKLNPTASITETRYGNIDPKELLNLQAFELKRVLDFDPEFLDEDQDHQHDSTVSSVAVKVKGNIYMDMLDTWVSKLIGQDGANLYRYKGVLAVKGKDKKFVFQGVGMMFGGRFEGDWDKDLPVEERESRFVFIGKNLDHNFLRNGFLACQVSHKLRFKVGDQVEANVGEFRKGTVIETMDDGNAYAIRIDDDKGPMEVWAPIDNDYYVRPPQDWILWTA